MRSLQWYKRGAAYAYPLIYDTSMILLSPFSEKSHSVKPSEC